MPKPSSTPKSAAYVAFLRGINVGGKKIIRMEELKKAVAPLGFANVTTILASGNVLFQCSPATTEALAQRIEQKLEKVFRMEIGTIVRSVEEIRRLAAAQPFKGIAVTPQTRLYVTFLAQRPAGQGKAPAGGLDRTFRFVRVSPSEVCSVLTLTPQGGTLDLMAVLEKQFGKKITTRNWSTIARILKAAG